MAARTLEQSRSDSSIASNEWFEGFSPTSHRPIISKDSEMYISATAVNVMPSITDSDETDQPLNQQRRDRHDEQCNAMPATQMLTAATIQRSVKEAMRETLSELKDDILAPMAQRIMNLEERVDKIEKKIETESTTKRTEPKRHDSEIARLNKQIETTTQEMKKLPTQLKTTTTPEKNNNLVIVGIDEEEGENTLKNWGASANPAVRADLLPSK